MILVSDQVIVALNAKKAIFSYIMIKISYISVMMMSALY
jgi:hypothetical protein